MNFQSVTSTTLYSSRYCKELKFMRRIVQCIINPQATAKEMSARVVTILASHLNLLALLI